MTEIEKSYLAGFFDGEGNINICKGTLQVSVAQVDREIVDYIKARYGGSITKRFHSLKNPKWHDAYQWNTKTRKARIFLEDILPYLRFKKEKAIAAIEHQRQKTAFWQSDEGRTIRTKTAREYRFGNWMKGRKLPESTLNKMRVAQQLRRHPVTKIEVIQ